MSASTQRLRIPCATYRLQFNRHFTFKMARELAPYLHDLGITDCYSSPVFLAPPESNHGYDVCDYNQFNPVLGKEEDWIELNKDLRGRGMGLLIDFVPNHMATDLKLNGWWRDVLEFGIESEFAHFFDIDWNPPDASLKNKVLLPILEDDFEKVLKQGLFKLSLEDGTLCFTYRNHRLPLNPRTYRQVLAIAATHVSDKQRKPINELFELLPVDGQPIDRAKLALAHRLLKEHAFIKIVTRLDGDSSDAKDHLKPKEKIDLYRDLLERQSYRLAFWKTGTLMSNYRRFFDVDTLAAVNMERPEVFEAAHGLLLRCAQAGQITGIRLDHIDGLADPAGYLRSLQTHLAKYCGVELPEDGRTFYVLVEKITMEGEPLRADWPVFGTTGYEFANSVIGLFVDRSQEATLTKTYSAFTGEKRDFAEVVKNSKPVIFSSAMSKEIAMLNHLLVSCAEKNPELRQLSSLDLMAALKAVIAALPVYRTYAMPGGDLQPADREILDQAISQSQAAHQYMDRRAFDCIKQVLVQDGQPASDFTDAANLFRRRFQQTTGAIMAKSYEDTAFFIYNRLIALNEVGGNPGRFGLDPSEFHESNAQRAKQHPHTMLTTSTHDTKLSEDARARVAAVSQLPSHWTAFLKSAAAANLANKTSINSQLAPDANEEYLLYQILLATWPLAEFETKSRAAYTERIQRHMLKACREAKVHARWDAPNDTWQSALAFFVHRAINDQESAFAECFRSLAQTVAEVGAVNSLSQTLLKLTAPGVPDVYQGNELWQFILTDPDNRDPIDFAIRKKILASLDKQTPASLMKDWRTGAIKMFLTRAVLNFRRAHPQLFDEGTYVPLECVGEHQANCVAFARVHNGKSVVVLAPRLTCTLGFPPVGNCWGSTAVSLYGVEGTGFKNLFTGETFKGTDLLLSQVFQQLPFAVLVTEKLLPG